MRSHRDILESKSLWSRFGPTTLSLAVVGVGVAGAIRIVHAEDTTPVITTLRAVTTGQDDIRRVPDPIVESKKAAQRASEDEKRAAEQLYSATRAAQRSEDVDDPAMRKELEALERQRESLEERISALRSRARSRAGRDAEARVRDSIRSKEGLTLRGNTLVLPKGSRDLTPEQRRSVDEAMKTAQEAMRMAEKAMQEAMRSMPKGEGFQFFHDGDNARIIVPAVPKVTIPKIELKDLPKVKGEARSFFFNDGKNAPKIFRWDGKELKGGEWNSKDAEKWQKEFQEEWSKKWPEFEKQMQELQSRMERWQRDFEQKMRERFRDDARTRSKDKEEEEDEDKEVKTKTKKTDTIKTSSLQQSITADVRSEDVL